MKRITGRLSLALTLLTLVGLTVPALADPAPELGACQKLQVPAGNTVALHTYAVGVQIYRWNGAKWAFVAPEAVLFADAGHESVVGIHFAGPTWETVNGSTAVGVVLERCTPDPTAIPWLLLGGVSVGRAGALDQVTYVQRLNTVGGNAPTNPGASSGEEARVPYTADYVFYRAAA